MADRLSNLPESLQLRILSCLEARHAVQTMVLSKSWFSTWTGTPDLKFTSHGFENLDVFDNFVVNVISRRQPVKLDRLTFKHDGKYYPRSLKIVFDCTFSHGVQELEADIDYVSIWPIDLHTSSDSLTSLKLFIRQKRSNVCCSFLKPRSGSFKNLTNLHLKKARITDLDSFSGFPVLDKLRLDFCFVRTKGMVLNVHAAQLSEITVSSYDYVHHCVFTTPKLRYFKWGGRNFPRLVTHEGGFPMLDTVVIDYNGFPMLDTVGKVFDDLLMLFNTLHNAKSLTLFSPVVHLLRLFPVNGCSPFRELKLLKLDFRCFWYHNGLQAPDSELTRELLEHVPGLKAYLLPESHDAKCSVMVTDNGNLSQNCI
ncbi:F-box/FBD/LRR-repeat protein At1g16930-like [Bidens hawaiensis]|uniref:F-box/FBD/LRR-repeat protein At1g16930-like n=1 Tax=Bidens hawaiensis TaxID=980011 RepID=UPI00404A2772